MQTTGFESVGENDMNVDEESYSLDFFLYGTKENLEKSLPD